MSKQWGFGVVGCGVIGKLHAAEIDRLEGARLVAVADIEKEKAEEIAVGYEIEAYKEFRDLLTRPDIDIVNICTPSGNHVDLATEAARAGKHVIVEKPIDVTLEKADQIIRVCREESVKLGVISQHRFDGSTMRVKEEIENGKLGKLFLGEAAVNWYRSQGYYDSGEWRGTYELDGGGSLMNQSIHTIDLLQYLMGPVESIFAEKGTLNHQIEVEDVAVATVKFQNGGLGTIVGTTAAYPGLSARIEVFGTKGSAVIDSDQLTHLYELEDPVEGAKYEVEAVNLAPKQDHVLSGAADPAAIATNAHGLQFKDFIEALEDDREPLVNGEEGRKPLEIIKAIYKSAEIGQKVTLPL